MSTSPSTSSAEGQRSERYTGRDAESTRGSRPGPAVAPGPEELERCRRATWAYGYAALGDREAAADLTQEALLLALSRQGELRDPSRFPTYLRRTVENLCRNRRRDRKDEVSLDLLPDPGARLLTLRAPSAEQVALEREDERRIHAAIAHLPLLYQEVFALRYLQGRHYTEMSEALAVHLETLRTRLQKARRLFIGDLASVESRGRQLPLSCEQCRELFPLFPDGCPTYAEVRRIHQHLDECRPCSDELDMACSALRQAQLADGSCECDDWLGSESTPRVYRTLWARVAGGLDACVQDPRAGLRVMGAFGVSRCPRWCVERLLLLATACVAAHPSDPAAHLLLGQVLRKGGDLDGALVVFEKQLALASAPQGAARVRARAEALHWQHHTVSLMGEDAYWLGRTRELRIMHRRSADLALESLRPGHHLHGQGKDLSLSPAHLGRAEAALREAARHGAGTPMPRGVRSSAMVARVCTVLGHADEALKHRRQAVSEAPLDHNEAVAMAQLQEVQGRAEGAAFRYRRYQASRRDRPRPKAATRANGPLCGGRNAATGAISTRGHGATTWQDRIGTRPAATIPGRAWQRFEAVV